MKKRQGGFTLVELVIVIAIIGVLTAIAIPTFASVIKSANKTADIQQMRQLNLMLFTGEIDKSELKEYSLLSSGWELAYSESENKVVIIDNNGTIVAAENDSMVGSYAQGYVKVTDLVFGGGEGEDPNGSNGGGEGEDPDGSNGGGEGEDPDGSNGGGEGEDPDGSNGGGEGEDPDGSNGEWWELVEPLSTLPEVNSSDYNALKEQTEINLGGISEIDSDYFKNFTSLVRIYLGEEITVIPSGAFNGCISLQEVSIGGIVTEVGARAFRNCTALKILSLPNVISLGEYAFTNCEFETLTITCIPSGSPSVANLHVANGSLDSDFAAGLTEMVQSDSKLQTIMFTNSTIKGSVSLGFLTEDVTVYLDEATATNIGDYSTLFGNATVQLI